MLLFKKMVLLSIGCLLSVCVLSAQNHEHKPQRLLSNYIPTPDRQEGEGPYERLVTIR